MVAVNYRCDRSATVRPHGIASVVAIDALVRGAYGPGRWRGVPLRVMTAQGNVRGETAEHLRGRSFAEAS